MTPLRILHIHGSMAHGGAEMRTVDIMRNLDRARFQLDYCAISDGADALDAEIRALGGAVHVCNLGHGFAGRFRALLRAGRYDIVHSHVHYSSGLILKLAAAERVPMRIAHFRNTDDGRPNTLRRRVQRALMRWWIDRHATRILAVNEGSMAQAWRPDWRRDPRCRVIYNGLDLGQFAETPDAAAVRAEFDTPAEAPLVIHVGRLEPQKNHPRLLALFAALTQRMPDARLWLVYRANPVREGELRALAAELGVGDRVRFIGERFDVPRLLQSADLLLLPSRFEGLPGVVLESCLAGTPVLATDLPGVREIAPHFPGHVGARSLDEADVAWADDAVALLAHRPTPDTRATAKTHFAGSIFHINRCVADHVAVWEDGPRRASVPAST